MPITLTSSLLNRARDLIASSDPQAAVNLLLPVVQGVDPVMGNELIMQAARARDAATGERQGVLSPNEAVAAKQRVGFALLELIGELQRQAVDDSEPIDEKVTSTSGVRPSSMKDAARPRARPKKAEEPLIRNQVFVSYSHADRPWLERLQRMLAPLIRNNTVDLWDDTRIRTGTQWHDEINRALKQAAVAVLIVSDDFLSSEFIYQNELPTLIDAADANELTVIWVYVSACLYEETAIARYQAAHDVRQPLDALSEAEQNEVLKLVSRKILAAVSSASA